MEPSAKEARRGGKGALPLSTPTAPSTTADKPSISAAAQRKRRQRLREKNLQATREQLHASSSVKMSHPASTATSKKRQSSAVRTHQHEYADDSTVGRLRKQKHTLSARRLNQLQQQSSRAHQLDQSGDTTASEDEDDDGAQRSTLTLNNTPLSLMDFIQSVPQRTLNFRHQVLERETAQILSDMKDILKGADEQYKKEASELHAQAVHFRDSYESECKLHVDECIEDMKKAIETYQMERSREEVEIRGKLRSRLLSELSEVKRALTAFDEETAHKFDVNYTPPSDADDVPMLPLEEHEEDDDKFSIPSSAQMHTVIDKLSGRKPLPTPFMRYQPKRIPLPTKQTNARIQHLPSLDIDSSLLSLTPRQISEDLRKIAGFEKVPGKLVRAMRRKERLTYYNVPAAYIVRKTKGDDVDSDPLLSHLKS